MNTLLLDQLVSLHEETPLSDLSKEELIQRLEKAYAWIENVRGVLEGIFHMEKKKVRQKKSPDTLEQSQKEKEKRLQKEKKEWDLLLPVRTRRKGPRPGELMGYWQPEQYILKPVRHYADCYPRQLMLRNINKPKMLSSVLCLYFYPSYRSTYATRVYMDAEKADKVWLRDEEQRWHSLPFRTVVKNMMFHVVSAYNDLIRREKSILSEEDHAGWRTLQHVLEHPQLEAYQFIVSSLEKRIPKLVGTPQQEEEKIADILWTQRGSEFESDFEKEIAPDVVDRTTQRRQYILHRVRHEMMLTHAKKCYEGIPDLTNEGSQAMYELNKAVHNVEHEL
jgi:hypothetical protein